MSEYLLPENLKRALQQHFAAQPWHVANDYMLALGNLPPARVPPEPYPVAEPTTGLKLVKPEPQSEPSSNPANTP